MDKHAARHHGGGRGGRSPRRSPPSSRRAAVQDHSGSRGHRGRSRSPRRSPPSSRRAAVQDHSGSRGHRGRSRSPRRSPPSSRRAAVEDHSGSRGHRGRSRSPRRSPPSSRRAAVQDHSGSRGHRGRSRSPRRSPPSSRRAAVEDHSGSRGHRGRSRSPRRSPPSSRRAAVQDHSGSRGDRGRSKSPRRSPPSSRRAAVEDHSGSRGDRGRSKSPRRSSPCSGRAAAAGLSPSKGHRGGSWSLPNSPQSSRSRAVASATSLDRELGGGSTWTARPPSRPTVCDQVEGGTTPVFHRAVSQDDVIYMGPVSDPGSPCTLKLGKYRLQSSQLSDVNSSDDGDTVATKVTKKKKKSTFQDFKARLMTGRTRASRSRSSELVDATPPSPPPPKGAPEPSSSGKKKMLALKPFTKNKLKNMKKGALEDLFLEQQEKLNKMNEDLEKLKSSTGAGSLSFDTGCSYLPNLLEHHEPFDRQKAVDEVVSTLEDKYTVSQIREIVDLIVELRPPVDWKDLAGMGKVRDLLEDIVVNPLLRPDIYRGLREPEKGVLLFGPPGTGKTMIGKCLASQAGVKLFVVTAAGITSKWVGEGEKKMRVLFDVARALGPSIIFFDEVDTLLSEREGAKDSDCSGKIKSEFLSATDGVTCGPNQPLVVGATNFPNRLDRAVRRRFTAQLYIDLPDDQAREELIKICLRKVKHDVKEEEVQKIVKECKGYSGADIKTILKEAARQPLKNINLKTVDVADIRPMTADDIMTAARQRKPSVAAAELTEYITYNRLFGMNK